MRGSALPGPAGNERLSARPAQAFTLLELLVAFAVLAGVMAILLGAFSNFSQVASTSNKRMESNKQPRAMFDRMAFDISSAVSTGGVRLVFKKDAALPGGTVSKNDALILLTDAKTRDAQSRLAKIGYAVGSYTDQSRQTTIETVLRYVEPFLWDDDTTNLDISGAADAQPIAPGIIRFELAFVARDGVITAAPPTDEADLREFYENLTSVICTVATLDQDTLQKLKPGERDLIVDRLPNAANVEAPLALWQAADLTDLPRPVVQGIRFHQRYFQLK